MVLVLKKKAENVTAGQAHLANSRKQQWLFEKYSGSAIADDNE